MGLCRQRESTVYRLCWAAIKTRSAVNTRPENFPLTFFLLPLFHRVYLFCGEEIGRIDIYIFFFFLLKCRPFALWGFSVRGKLAEKKHTSNISQPSRTSTWASQPAAGHGGKSGRELQKSFPSCLTCLPYFPLASLVFGNVADPAAAFGFLRPLFCPLGYSGGIQRLKKVTLR